MNTLTYLLNKIVEFKLNPTDQCVEWPFALNRGGYGEVWFQGKIKRASRVAYELFHGKPARQLVLHTCDNPKCFNPAHLYVGDHKKNSQDAKERGRLVRVKKQKATNQKGPYRPGTTKLDDNDVIAIVRMLKDGQTVREVAAHFPVSFQAVGLIKQGKTWKHIPR